MVRNFKFFAFLTILVLISVPSMVFPLKSVAFLSSLKENPTRYSKVSRDDLTDRQDNEKSSDHRGRVQIKVYRGPDIKGENNEHFAPFGYWIKQPADNELHS